MNLDEILNEWKKDSHIDFNKLDVTSQETPKLHAKYLELYSNAKLKLKDAEFKQRKLLLDKKMYYEGKMSREEMDSRGWAYDPYDGILVKTNKDREYYYETDPDIQASEAKIVYLEETINALKEILDNLRWRHSTIRNMIEWKRFEAGF